MCGPRNTYISLFIATNAQLNKPVVSGTLSTGGAVAITFTTSVSTSGCGIAVPGSQEMCEEEERERGKGG